jgi:hypothetical protein
MGILPRADTRSWGFCGGSGAGSSGGSNDASRSDVFLDSSCWLVGSTGTWYTTIKSIVGRWCSSKVASQLIFSVLVAGFQKRQGFWVREYPTKMQRIFYWSNFFLYGFGMCTKAIEPKGRRCERFGRLLYQASKGVMGETLLRTRLRV